jgi:hypothetical protein
VCQAQNVNQLRRIRERLRQSRPEWDPPGEFDKTTRRALAILDQFGGRPKGARKYKRRAIAARRMLRRTSRAICINTLAVRGVIFQFFVTGIGTELEISDVF